MMSFDQCSASLLKLSIPTNVPKSKLVLQTGLTWLGCFDFTLEPISGNNKLPQKFLLVLKVDKSDKKIIISLLLPRRSLNF